MKKFMKALAFATVMCMLLSTAAFATNPAATLDQATDYKFTVTVTTEADTAEQVSLLVVKSNATLATLQNTDILFVGQEDSNGTSATFADIVVDGTKVTDGMVDIYAGYASNSEEAAVCYNDFPVVNVREIAITLVETEIVDDVTTWNKLTELTEEQKATLNAQLPEREIASMVRAKVNFANTANKTIDKVGWEFVTGSGSRYAELDAAGYEIVDGDVLMGVTFVNGWKAEFEGTNGYNAHLPINKVNLFFRVDNKEVQAAEATN